MDVFLAKIKIDSFVLTRRLKLLNTAVTTQSSINLFLYDHGLKTKKQKSTLKRF